MKTELLHQQNLLWEFYKTWVSHHNRIDGKCKETDMHKLYERLNALLTIEADPEVQTEENSVLMIKRIEKDFSSVVQFIADVVAPEKIFCLSHEKSEEGTGYADLLLVIPDACNQTFLEIEPMINFTCLKYHNLSCSLFKESYFFNGIREGHIYYSLACNPDNLIYDQGRSELPKLKLENTARKIEKTKLEFYKGFSKAKTFYDTAEIHRENNLMMAAFMLHQATEFYLRTLTKSLTGHDRATHGLAALLKSSLRFTSKLSLLMNNKEPEDERLMELLEMAYLGYRYSDKYQIEKDDLNKLFEKIKEMHELTEQTFLEWMGRYDLLVNSIQNLS